MVADRGEGQFGSESESESESESKSECEWASSPTGRTAVILAGGYSRRFGDADKAVAELAGTPMIRHVADRLAPVVETVVVNCRAEQRPAIREALADGVDPMFAVDPVPGRGPMSGILTGLRATHTDVVAVVACDMPFVDPDFVSSLFAQLSNADDTVDPEAIVPQLEFRHLQPTQAVYRTQPMIDACERALARGDSRVQDALAELESVVLDEHEVRERTVLESFENVNTQAKLEAVAKRL
ncbi:molybdopterin-guanine dinucleotide biosynthesis protein A [Natrialba chahannaoensis JCM 10990]|uniref:Probable molybdenum cofactor guanylyltransferase n=1 Tax=Natrialba chahannaoensis JCM 10990 TaxID=1227492 RepID=M0ABT8_9EURY|nr:molybdenum cofactor guanylyltransferase [Natrialba chahannaoensis]ELY94823.1 molybdopterin-guanine dinucleotide biosynthesis protein A [Natrialba chahannaoensis JCM 10990]